MSCGRKIKLFRNGSYETELVSDEWKLEEYRFYSFCILIVNIMSGLNVIACPETQNSSLFKPSLHDYLVEIL